MYELFDKENEVMEIFWKLDRPCLISEILRESPSLSRSTVSKVLVRLEQQGFLKVDSLKKSVTRTGRAYVAAISKEQYETCKEIGESLFDNRQLPNNTLKLVSCLLKTSTVEDSFIQELEQMIQDYKNSNEK